jgi:hypothetical protein
MLPHVFLPWVDLLTHCEVSVVAIISYAEFLTAQKEVVVKSSRSSSLAFYSFT